MRDGRCPKCGSQDVYCGERALHGETVIDVRVRTPGWNVEDFPLSCYLCVACGYVELYAEQAGSIYGKSLRELIDAGEGWRRVGPAGPVQLPPGQSVCPSCGAPLRTGQVYCSCGTRIAAG